MTIPVLVRKYGAPLFLSTCFIINTSCEKVIDVNLENAAKKYVVEGVITNQAGNSMVLVSQTKNFDASNDLEGVSGATVTISDENGNATSLEETAPGVYEAASLTGAPGKTYTLTVAIGGNSFIGQSTMPHPVHLDTIYASADPAFNRRLVTLEYEDPAGQSNYYRFVQYNNGIKEKKIFTRTDDLTDGNRTVTKLRYPDDDDNDLQTGDNITVLMYCIDPEVYKYWYSLDRSATGSNQSASPANPVTNIKGGALGYFSAHTIQARAMIVP